MIKTFIKTFWESTVVNGESFLAGNGEDKLNRTKLLIHLFYFLTLLTSVQTFSTFYQFPDWNLIIESKDLFLPIWSMKWLPIDSWEIAVRAILVLFLVFSAIGVIFWERSRLIRVGVFLFMFFYVSLISSFGKIDHYMHIMVIASFLLIFVPNKNSGESYNGDFLKVFFGIQALILLTYFTSGIFKLYGILDQVLLGQVSALSPESLALHLSKTSLAANSDYFLSSLILNYPSPLFSIVLIGGFCVEFFSIYVIFKPRLHRIWGLFLILLHTGILLTVGPDFTQQILMVGIFLLFSPFADLQVDLASDFLGVFQRINKRIRSRKRKKDFIVFYDGECPMCNGFLEYISRFDLPKEIRASKLQGARYKDILKEKIGLAEIDSIVVLEIDETNGNIIRIKADGIVWVLSKIKSRFILLRIGYIVFPFIGNCIYDLVAKYRKKADHDVCPIPPVKIREILLD